MSKPIEITATQQANAALKAIRAIRERVTIAVGAGLTPAPHDAEQLAQLFGDLDEWCRRGVLPDDWKIGHLQEKKP